MDSSHHTAWPTSLFEFSYFSTALLWYYTYHILANVLALMQTSTSFPSLQAPCSLAGLWKLVNLGPKPGLPSGEDLFHTCGILGVIHGAGSEKVTLRELDESPPNWWWLKWLLWQLISHPSLLSPTCSDGIKESYMPLMCNRRQGCLLLLMYLLVFSVNWSLETHGRYFPFQIH